MAQANDPGHAPVPWRRVDFDTEDRGIEHVTFRGYEEAVSQKRCTKCLELKPLSDYGPAKLGKHGVKSRCKPCLAQESGPRNRVMVEQRKQRLKDDPEYRRVIRDANLRFKYGFGVERYEEILAGQGGRCAICGTSEPGGSGNFHVDHSHECCPGRNKKTCGQCVRGLLCNHCNVGLGHFLDDPELLTKAAAYLEAARG